MNQTKTSKALDHLHPSDLRGIAQLATQATGSVARMAEGVHQSVWRVMGAPGGPQRDQTRGLTGFVYRRVHDVTQLVGKGVDAALARLVPLMEGSGPARPVTPEREAALAILNGVMGDHLAASGNPLALPMVLRHQGQPLRWDVEPHPAHLAGAGPKVLLMMHGLCMNDLQWAAKTEDGQRINHGEAVAAELGYTPVYLRYNTGLHVSQNGHQLADELEKLVQNWPVPIEDLTVLVHSMGGLVIRSAVHVARQKGLSWPGRLKSIVFLGTPHHGSPLERAGNWVDTLLDSTPFTAPFSSLGKLRSAGITDLRYGHVLDADWQGHDRFQRKPDSRIPLPLPEGVACYAVAATLASEPGGLADRLAGDGLVPLNSALGKHDEPGRSLVFAKDSQWVSYNTGHMALLSRRAVTDKVLQWLRPAPAPGEDSA